MAAIVKGNTTIRLYGGPLDGLECKAPTPAPEFIEFHVLSDDGEMMYVLAHTVVLAKRPITFTVYRRHKDMPFRYVFDGWRKLD
jgi:hypothetical protein